MAGTTRTVKNRVTERLIRMTPTNHILIRGVKRDSVNDSRNLGGHPLTIQAALALGRSATFKAERGSHSLMLRLRSSETQNMSSPVAAATTITGPLPEA